MTQYRSVFLAGRAGGMSGGAWVKAGTRRHPAIHLVPNNASDYAPALCGARPTGSSAGWAAKDGDPAETATCARCRSRASSRYTEARAWVMAYLEDRAETECAESRQIHADKLAEGFGGQP